MHIFIICHYFDPKELVSNNYLCLILLSLLLQQNLLTFFVSAFVLISKYYTNTAKWVTI